MIELLAAVVFVVLLYYNQKNTRRITENFYQSGAYSALKNWCFFHRGLPWLQRPVLKIPNMKYSCFLSALHSSLTWLRRERSVSIRKKYLEPRVTVLSICAEWWQSLFWFGFLVLLEVCLLFFTHSQLYKWYEGVPPFHFDGTSENLFSKGII